MRALKWLGSIVLLAVCVDLGVWGLHQLALRNSPGAFAPAAASPPSAASSVGTFACEMTALTTRTCTAQLRRDPRSVGYTSADAQHDLLTDFCASHDPANGVTAVFVVYLPGGSLFTRYEAAPDDCGPQQ